LFKLGLEGEQYLTDKEISVLLKISRRSLQDYRTEGRIPFYRIGGKSDLHIRTPVYIR
jgi:excisionase family DNA binding protein